MGEPGARTTSVRRDLSPAGAVERLDRAVTLARSGGLELAARAWGAGAAPALVLVALWYVERVEGVSALRGVFAIGLALAWWARAVVLGRVARAHVLRLWEAAPIPADAGRISEVARTAGWLALGLWGWSWLIVLGALAGPLGIALVVPLFAVRGALAPSWLARASCGREAGLAALRGALSDSSGQRFAGLVAELLVLVGALGLFVNALGAIAVVLVLGRSFLGLDLATLDAFLSARNTFLLLVTALAVLVVLEPLRAAMSALTWVEARVRAEGLDLRLAMEEAIARATQRRSAVRAAAVLALVLVAGASGAVASAVAEAQALPPPPLSPGLVPEPPPLEPTPLAEPAPDPADAAAIEAAERILGEPEFREFEDTRGRGLRELVERVLEWLFRHRDPIEAPAPPRVPPIPLPGPMVFLALAAIVVVLVGILLYATRPLRRAGRSIEVPGSASPVAVIDPRERAPTEWVDDAARLAAEGRYREALRALYLATLVALDRRALIRFDPTLTNGQYLRQMPEGEARSDFRDFTRHFDRTWYGQEPAGEHDYRTCRALAERIVAIAPGGPR